MNLRGILGTHNGLDVPEIESWGENFSSLSRLALGSSQPRVKMCPGLSRGQNDQGEVLTTFSLLAPRFAMGMSYTTFSSLCLQRHEMERPSHLRT